jgi:hypothetical protein
MFLYISYINSSRLISDDSTITLGLPVTYFAMVIMSMWPHMLVHLLLLSSLSLSRESGHKLGERSARQNHFFSSMKCSFSVNPLALAISLIWRISYLYEFSVCMVSPFSK